MFLQTLVSIHSQGPLFIFVPLPDQQENLDSVTSPCQLVILTAWPSSGLPCALTWFLSSGSCTSSSCTDRSSGPSPVLSIGGFVPPAACTSVPRASLMAGSIGRLAPQSQSGQVPGPPSHAIPEEEPGAAYRLTAAERMPMLVSFGGAEECPGVMFTCSMRSRAPFSATEILWERIREESSDCFPLNYSVDPQAHLHGGLVVWEASFMLFEKNSTLEEGYGGKPRTW